MKHYLRPIGMGLLVYFLVFFCHHAYSMFILTSGEAEAAGRLIFFPSTLLSAMMLILPGYASGRVAKKRGIVIGLLVGFLCSSLRFTIFSINWASPHLDGALFMIGMEQTVLPALTGAVSGAAGELHSRVRR